MSNKTVIKRQGLMRLIFTLSHSFNGLKWMSRFEAAFQQELGRVDLCGLKFVQSRGDLIAARGL